MKLSGKLQEWWFEANPYDSCVVNHKQCTIGWHVDDVRCSHVDPMVMEHMIDLMSKEFGKDAPLTVSCDKVHEYLGMPFYFTEEGAITIDMSDYVKTIIADMPEEMIGKAPTPAAIACFKSEKGQYRSKRRKPIRSIKSIKWSCSCSISVSEDDPMCGPQYCSCASRLAHQMKMTTRVMRYLQSTNNLKLMAAVSFDVGWIPLAQFIPT